MNRLDQNCIGRAIVVDEFNKSEVKIDIIKTKLNGEYLYTAILTKDQKVEKLGEVRFSIRDTECVVFATEKTKTRSIKKYFWISRIDSFQNKQYSRVGTVLMKCVMERAWKEKDQCYGEVLLAATKESIPFYWKLDMKCSLGDLVG